MAFAMFHRSTAKISCEIAIKLFLKMKKAISYNMLSCNIWSTIDEICKTSKARWNPLLSFKKFSVDLTSNEVKSPLYLNLQLFQLCQHLKEIFFWII